MVLTIYHEPWQRLASKQAEEIVREEVDAKTSEQRRAPTQKSMK